MKNILIILSIILLPFSLISEDVFIFIGQENYEPFNIKINSNEYSGLDVELITEAAKRANIKVKIITATWSRALFMVENGTADGIFGCGKTIEREAFLYYPETPLRFVTFRFFTNETYKTEIKYLSDLDNIKVGLVKNYFISTQIEDSLFIKKRIVSNTHKLFKLLSENRYSVAIYSSIAGIYEIKQEGYSEIKSYPYNNAPVYPSYLAFSKISENGLKAFNIFSEVLKEMEEDGTLLKIYNKYLEY